MGLIHLDAGVVIGFLDGDDVHHLAARAVFAEALRNGDRLAVAASAFAECLVARLVVETQRFKWFASSSSGSLFRSSRSTRMLQSWQRDSVRCTARFACPMRSSSPPQCDTRPTSSSPPTDVGRRPERSD